MFELRRDLITDEPIILLRREAFSDTPLGLVINLSQPEHETLAIIGHDFPGKLGAIRIDENAPIITDSSGCLFLSQALDLQLAAGKRLIIRGCGWPQTVSSTKIIDLEGYGEVTSFLRGFL